MKAVAIHFHFFDPEMQDMKIHYDERLGVEAHFSDGTIGKVGIYKLEKHIRKYCKKHGILLPPRGDE